MTSAMAMTTATTMMLKQAHQHHHPKQSHQTSIIRLVLNVSLGGL